MEHVHRKLTFYSSNVYSPPQESYGIGNSFYPLEGLRREDADIALIFLGTSARYTKPVDDPWFSAHKWYQMVDRDTGKITTLYTPDNPVSLMGCKIQVSCHRVAHLGSN
jgi:hypothetical protein